MTHLLAVGGAAFVFIFLKAFQQRNVIFDAYALVLPTSWAMAAAEVYVVATVAVQGWDWALVLVIGTGAGLGAMTAMAVHRRLVGRREKDDA